MCACPLTTLWRYHHVRLSSDHLEALPRCAPVPSCYHVWLSSDHLKALLPCVPVPSCHHVRLRRHANMYAAIVCACPLGSLVRYTKLHPRI